MTQPTDNPTPATAGADAAPLGRYLVVISGPSGAGKTSIVREVADRLGLPLSVSATTRPPREGEVDGRDYHFVDEATFRRRAGEGGFVEWAEVFGRLYGTPLDEVERARDRRDLLLLEIDVQGGIQVKERHPEALAILVLPPEPEALRARLTARGTDSPEEIQRRLDEAAREVKAARDAGCYDREVVNDRLEDAVQHVVQWLQTRRNQV